MKERNEAKPVDKHKLATLDIGNEVAIFVDYQYLIIGRFHVLVLTLVAYAAPGAIPAPLWTPLLSPDAATKTRSFEVRWRSRRLAGRASTVRWRRASFATGGWVGGRVGDGWVGGRVGEGVIQ